MRTLSRAATTALLLALASGCAGRTAAQRVSQPVSPERDWATSDGRDHPLVGRIWDVRRQALVDEAALRAEVERADFVLLGEIHDNPDHHLLQARLVRAVTGAGRRPALAFEMLDSGQQPAIDAALARSPGDAGALGKAVDWDHSGWPKFALYRPIFEAGLEAGLPIVAANLPREQLRGSFKKGAEALPEDVRGALEREGPPSQALRDALREEMSESHCGELPESMLDPLILAQRARDAVMALRMTGAGDRGAVLIAGAGHVRNDRGVPSFLAREAAGKTAVAIAFQEVKAEAKTPNDHAAWYGGDTHPFDYVVFTPGLEREDPCEKLRGHMERKAAKEAKEKAAAEAGTAPAKPAEPGPVTPGGDPAPVKEQ